MLVISMNTTQHTFSARKFTSVFYVIIVIVPVFTEDLPAPDGSNGICMLKFNEFPYEPTAECIIGHSETYKYLGTLTTTRCCQNVLDVLTKLLARQLQDTKGGDIFISQDKWSNCSGGFQRQDSVSLHSCGFDHFYNGSQQCSSFTVDMIQGSWYYHQAIEACVDFRTPSFDKSCLRCASGLVQARDHQTRMLGVNDDDETEVTVCGVAVVVAVVAAKLNDSEWIDDFYKCLPILDEFDSDFLKLRYSVLKTVSAIVIAVVAVLLLLILIKYVTKGKGKEKKTKPKKPRVQSREFTKWSGLYRFSKSEIENAISYYREKRSLGRGSAGHVYRGVLPSGQVVAIKHIDKSSSSDSFRREVEGLSRVRHANLVCLFGHCIEGGERYLVYEYCSAGNLAQQLLRKDTLLTWYRRVKILRDCAQGLRYLHHHIDGCIVHRDIKLTNILLTESLDPKLSDFGLAKMLGVEESKVFTDVRGTIGYMDPEYMSNAKLTCGSDIYSFGIVILQVLSGQKVFELDFDARDQLTRKAKDVSWGKRPLTDFIDSRLNGQVNEADFQAILNIAVLCVAKSSKGRPTIDIVFEEMDKVYKNTPANMEEKNDTAMSTTASKSQSIEVVSI